jgi:hypothetical protein
VRTNSIATGFIWLTVTSIIQPQFLYADDAAQSKSPAINETTVRGILGRPVQGADGKEMGRVIDVIVDSAGRVRAAVIDFGGFLGVGSRKIAVNWSALRFDDAVKDEKNIRLALTQDQLKAAPEYKDGSPSVAISSTGALEPLNTPPVVAPEEK